jgi:ubiquinone/menaquinone biosynthesis C-methylase UbiE
MDIYQHFSRAYDAFMRDIPYKKWSKYIYEVLCSHGVPKGGLVLDLACGTGTMAFLLAQKGYEIIGVDASVDMLSEAYLKMQEEGSRILFLNQDIRALDLYGTVDAAYSSCDGLNYMLTEDDLEKVIKNVALYLNTGGIFVFDLKTDHKYRQLGSGNYYDNTDTASYIWKNHYDPATGINEYEVQFFFKEGSETVTVTETHRQRAYDIAIVTDLIKRAGLKLLSVCDNYTYNPAGADSVRVTYVCKLTD